MLEVCKINIMKIEFIRSEYIEQIQFVNWLEQTYPGILFSSSCGGMRTSIGTAVKMKRAGYKKGCPDIMIFEPRGQYHGLFIEMKREKKSVISPEQKVWINELNKRNYKAVICYGFEDAKKTVEKYFEF